MSIGNAFTRSDDFKVLATDQATATGFAIGNWKMFEARAIVSGTFKAMRRPVLGERFLMFDDNLARLIAEHRPNLLAYEEPYVPQPSHMKAGAPSRTKIETLNFLQMLKGILVLRAARESMLCEGYTSDDWRHSLLGYSRRPKGAPKDHMKRAVRARLTAMGFAPKNYDESDAIGILAHALTGAPAFARSQPDLLDIA